MTRKDIRLEYRKSTGEYPGRDEYSLGGNLKSYNGADLIDYIDYLEEKLIEVENLITHLKNN